MWYFFSHSHEIIISVRSFVEECHTHYGLNIHGAQLYLTSSKTNGPDAWVQASAIPKDLGRKQGQTGGAWLWKKKAKMGSTPRSAQSLLPLQCMPCLKRDPVHCFGEGWGTAGLHSATVYWRVRPQNDLRWPMYHPLQAGRPPPKTFSRPLGKLS